MKRIFGFLTLITLVTITFSSCSTETNTDQESASTEAINLNQSPGQAVATSNTEGAEMTGYKVGDKATDFSLMGVDGKKHSLSEITDAKGFVVTFTCNECPYAKMYEDRLIKFHNDFAAKGYPVIAINPNDPEVQPGDSFEAMKVRAEEKKFPFVYLFDEGQAIYPQFGASRTPHVFVLDKDLVVRYIGAIDDNAQDASAVKVKYLEDAIGAIEAGKEPDPSFTKAVGCTIKAKKS